MVAGIGLRTHLLSRPLVCTPEGSNQTLWAITHMKNRVWGSLFFIRLLPGNRDRLASMTGGKGVVLNARFNTVIGTTH